MSESFAFFHLIKTGGTTISEHLYEHMPDAVFDEDARRFIPFEKCRFYSGHNTPMTIREKLPEPCHYMTIFRDPAEWLVSVYHHDMARRGALIPFEQWYDTPGPNTVNVHPHYRDRMFNWFSTAFCGGADIDRVKKILDDFWFVGDLDYLEVDLPLLFKRLGVPMESERKRVAGKYDPIDGVLIDKSYELTKYMRNRIYAENPLDVEIYRYAERRRDETRGNLWP